MLSAQELEEAAARVFPAAEKLGLAPGHVHFELVPAELVQTLASYGGLPVRYGHWSFGKTQQRLKTAFDFRATQIYELVINHVPAYAFVDRSCSLAQALMIVAHVSAHADFFRHHRGFSHLPIDMVSVAARHRRQLEEFRQAYGHLAVETLLDAAHILADFTGESLAGTPIGERPDDVLGYVTLNAPRLLDWERQVLSIVWEEARYFWPQQLTRTANEGYATFFHTKILRELSLSPAEHWETAHLNAQIVAVSPPQLNPYRLGYLLFSEAYHRGGYPELFQARDLYDDAGLVRAYLSADHAIQAGLALYRERDVESVPRLAPLEDLKQQLLTDLDRAGLPRLVVEKGGSELSLRHLYDGRDLDFAELPFALKLVAERIWQGPVAIYTQRQRVPHRASHNGLEWSDQVV